MILKLVMEQSSKSLKGKRFINILIYCTEADYSMIMPGNLSKTCQKM